MNGKCGLNWKYGLNWGELGENIKHIYYLLTWYSFSNTLGAWSYNGNNVYLQASLKSSDSGSKSYNALTFSIDVSAVKQIIINNTMVGGGTTDAIGYNYLNITGSGLTAQKYLFTPTTGTYTDNADLILDVSSLSGIVTFSVWVNQTVKTGNLVWSTNCNINISRMYPVYDWE